MKPISKQTNKWLLSTLLVAALGSQYYFSVSSKSLGSFEMSSTATEKSMQEEIDKLKLERTSQDEFTIRYAAIMAKWVPKLEAEKTPITATQDYFRKLHEINVKPNITVEEMAKEKAALSKDLTAKLAMEKRAQADAPAKTEAAAKKSNEISFKITPVTKPGDTEGKVMVDGTCETCETMLSLTGPNKMVEDFKKFLETYQKTGAAPTAAAATTTVAAPVKEAAAPMTEAEKREAARQKREDEKQAREDKRNDEREKIAAKKEENDEIARQKKEDRSEKFTEKAEKIAETCKTDVVCRVDSFKSLLASFSGTRNVDQSAVTKAYNLYIDKELKAGLQGPDSAEKAASLEALESLMALETTDYRSVKNRAVDSAKAVVTNEATAVNALYKQADIYKGQNKPREEAIARGQAISGGDMVARDATLIRQNIYEGLSSSNDSVTKTYFMNTYLNDVDSMLTRLTNTGGVLVPATTASTTTGPRGGRNGTSTVINGTTSSNVNDGVSFGTPGTARTTGSRTGSVQLK